MVVTKRRSTRVTRREEGGDAEQATMASPVRTRRTLRRDGPAEENDDNQDQDDSEISTLRSHIVTRRRHLSGQSNADVSEAESTASNSSARMTRSGKSLGHITGTPMKLRSQPSTLISEPIIESQEGELSEAESNCSSVSARARRRPTRTVSHSVKIRSQKSGLGTEPPSDLSETEPNSSSVPVVLSNTTRSTRKAELKRPSVQESQPEEISDKESCSTDYSLKPTAKHSSRKSTCKVLSEETDCVGEINGKSSQEQETVKSGNTQVASLSSVAEQNMISSPRRSTRNRAVSQREVLMSVHKAHNAANKVSGVKETENDEMSVRKDEIGLSVESITELSMSQSTEKENVPDQINDIAEVPSDKEEPKEQIPCQDDDTLDVNGTSKNRELAKVEEPAAEKETRGKGLVEQQDKEMEVCNTSAGEKDLEMVDENDVEVVEEAEDKVEEVEEAEDEIEEVGVVEGEVEEVEEEEDQEVEEEEDSEEEDIAVVDEVNTKQHVKPRKSSSQQLQDLADDGLFVIDKAPGLDSTKKYYVETEEKEIEEEAEESENEGPSKHTYEDDDEIEELFNKSKSGLSLSSAIDTGLDIKKLGGLYISFDAEKPKPGSRFFNKMKKENKKKDELLKKSVITPGFEKKEAIPPYDESQRQLKKKRKAEREKSTGQGWFDMKAPEMTEELKNDLKALKMRSAMDPKHFYKKNDRDGFPKYFQVGTVVDNPADFFHSRIPKKQRKRTIVEELLADAEFRRYNKKKYQEIMTEKAARAEGKKKRRKKKFRT